MLDVVAPAPALELPPPEPLPEPPPELLEDMVSDKLAYRSMCASNGHTEESGWLQQARQLELILLR